MLLELAAWRPGLTPWPPQEIKLNDVGIVRRLLFELGGSISLRGALGEGATFTVKIPKEMT